MAETSVVEGGMRVPEARYAYYRRCQVFLKGGEQCKAPAEKGSHICHTHAAKLATAVRREKERRAVLTEAVAQMRKRGKPECEMADLFMDFNGIQITVAVAAQALIEGRIDCKTAGRLVVELQTFSRLLRMDHRKGRQGRKEIQILQQTCASDRRLDTPEKSESRPERQHHTTNHKLQKDLPLIRTDDTDVRKAAKQLYGTTEICVTPTEYRACRKYRRRRKAPHVLTGLARGRQYRQRPEETHCTLKIFRHAALARAGSPRFTILDLGRVAHAGS